MNQQINQIIEQIKINLTDYQSQLNQIDLENANEKKSLLEAIQAEQAEIESLIDKYRQVKQKNEIEAVRSFFKHLSDFKRNLSSKIQSETNEVMIRTQPQPVNQSNSANSAAIPASEPKDNLPSKSATESEQLDPETKARQEATLAQLIDLFERTSSQELAKLYPADVLRIVPSFDVNDLAIRNQVLKKYQQSDRQIYDSLVKLYQKPYIDKQVAIPSEQEMSSKDKKHHDFLLTNYPKAIPLFWFLVNQAPDSIRYVVMEFAIHHIILTNNLDNQEQALSINLKYLLELNNEASLANFLRDLFISFHPKRFDAKNSGQSKYYDYINNIIIKQSTLDNSEVLQLWTYMNQSQYEQVVADNFLAQFEQKRNNLHNERFTSS
ncbi:MAG: hypothetical protein ACFCU7_08485 [Pleurocapsa sp.]